MICLLMFCFCCCLSAIDLYVSICALQAQFSLTVKRFESQKAIYVKFSVTEFHYPFALVSRIAEKEPQSLNEKSKIGLKLPRGV